MDGVDFTALKRIEHPKGGIYHALKASENSYMGFSEAYFTTIHFQQIKGWKKHLRMTMNLVVPVGGVRFYFRSDKGDTMLIDIGESNYQRITVKPGIWMAFQGLSTGLNLVLNLADIEHDPTEAVNVELTAHPL